ncbi:TPA: DUF2483 family protein, partial [Staphylococcus aureus]
MKQTVTYLIKHKDEN